MHLSNLSPFKGDYLIATAITIDLIFQITVKYFVQNNIFYISILQNLIIQNNSKYLLQYLGFIYILKFTHSFGMRNIFISQ